MPKLNCLRLFSSLVLSACGERTYTVQTNGMEPNVHQGNIVTLDTLTYTHSMPSRWDVVIYRNPAGGGESIQRIVGLPGETVDINGGMIWVNGSQMALPRGMKAVTYQANVEGHPSAITLPYTVPADSYFMLGDNTQESIDSRWLGAIPKRAIRAKVVE